MSPGLRSRITGLVLFAIAFAWSVIVYQTIPAGLGGGDIGARAFPLLLGLVLIGLSGFMVVRTFFERAASEVKPDTDASTGDIGREVRIVGGVFVTIVLYGFLLQRIGFLLATPLLVVLAMLLVLRMRNPVTICTMAVGLTFGCWLVFGKLLGAYLPPGTWIAG